MRAVLLLFVVSSATFVSNVQSETQTMKMVKLAPSLKFEEGAGCKCIDFDCGCCVDIHIEEIKLHEVSCVNLTYLPKEIGIRVSLVIGSFVVFNITVSARNPPPICLNLPYLHKHAHLCLYFHDLDISDKKFSGCLAMELKVLHFVHYKVELGCFNIPIPVNEFPIEAALVQPAKILDVENHR